MINFMQILLRILIFPSTRRKEEKIVLTTRFENIDPHRSKSGGYGHAQSGRKHTTARRDGEQETRRGRFALKREVLWVKTNENVI